MHTVPQRTTHLFLTNRRYVIEVLESQMDDVIGSSHSLTVASQVQDDESSSSATAAPSFTCIHYTHSLILGMEYPSVYYYYYKFPTLRF